MVRNPASVQVLAGKVETSSLIVRWDHAVQLVVRGRDIMRDVEHSQGRLPDELVTRGWEDVFGRSVRSDNDIHNVSDDIPRRIRLFGSRRFQSSIEETSIVVGVGGCKIIHIAREIRIK